MGNNQPLDLKSKHWIIQICLKCVIGSVWVAGIVGVFSAIALVDGMRRGDAFTAMTVGLFGTAVAQKYHLTHSPLFFWQGIPLGCVVNAIFGGFLGGFVGLIWGIADVVKKEKL